MAYASTTVKPSQLAGKIVVSVKVTPDAATGNIVISQLRTIDSILGVAFAGDVTANCYTAQAAINGSTANQVDIKLWKAGGTAADTAYVPLWVSVVGE
jgi:hypothetical protein